MTGLRDQIRKMPEVQQVECGCGAALLVMLLGTRLGCLELPQVPTRHLRVGRLALRFADALCTSLSGSWK